MHAATTSHLSLTTPTLLLGASLGAFFDGILLHQVLQWHHLLSLVGGEDLRDPRIQILADGMFHVAVYIALAAALALLWRSRAALMADGSGRRVWSNTLLGFGLWNVVDVVGFHWIAGIHRIRVDVDNPLAWDLGWLALFGAIPLLWGLWCRRRRKGGLGGDGARAGAGLTCLAIIAGTLALAPPPPDRPVAVLFRPGLTPGETMAAVAEAGASVQAVDGSGQVMVLSAPSLTGRWSLYHNGALIVGGAGPAACAALLAPSGAV